MIAHCTRCGKEYEQKRKNAIPYCSHDCYYKAQRTPSPWVGWVVENMWLVFLVAALILILVRAVK